MTYNRALSYHKLLIPISFTLAAKGTWQFGKPLRPVRLIVLHSAECGEVATAAEALASWASGTGHPVGASWHFAVDCDSITQSVELNDIAWHAGTVNGYSIGIEQAGRASQTTEQWNDDYSASMLANTAKLVAVIAGLYDIPIEHCTDLHSPNATGICTHADVTKALAVKNGHWDPGPNYPIDKVLTMARAFQLEAVQ